MVAAVTHDLPPAHETAELASGTHLAPLPQHQRQLRPPARDTATICNSGRLLVVVLVVVLLLVGQRSGAGWTTRPVAAAVICMAHVVGDAI